MRTKKHADSIELMLKELPGVVLKNTLSKEQTSVFRQRMKVKFDYINAQKRRRTAKSMEALSKLHISG